MNIKKGYERGRPLVRLRAREQAWEAEIKAQEKQECYFDVLNEKLYFHEIERRDKLGERLQIPLAMFVAIAGFVGQMLQNIERGQRSTWAVIFWGTMIVASIAFFTGLFYLLRILKGHIYSYLPTAPHWDAYRSQCESLYKEYKHASELVTGALQHALNKSYVDCWTRNAAINDQKSFSMQRLNEALGVAALAAFAAYFFFYFGELEKGLKNIDQRVQIVNPVTINGDIVTTQKPPPPPPPPPARQVREDHKPAPVPPKGK